MYKFLMGCKNENNLHHLTFVWVVHPHWRKNPLFSTIVKNFYQRPVFSYNTCLGANKVFQICTKTLMGCKNENNSHHLTFLWVVHPHWRKNPLFSTIVENFYQRPVFPYYTCFGANKVLQIHTKTLMEFKNAR